MSKVYRFYSDPGHGWLAVKITDLVRLGIVEKITSFSYIRGKTAYLEEDADLSTFVKALKANGEEFLNKEGSYNDSRSHIRSYDQYTLQKALNAIK